MAGYQQARAAKRAPEPEPFDRLTRKDFWNDPDRWEGIEDPHKTMIWEVRHRDVIDVREPERRDVAFYDQQGNFVGSLDDVAMPSAMALMQQSHLSSLALAVSRRTPYSQLMPFI